MLKEGLSSRRRSSVKSDPDCVFKGGSVPRTDVSSGIKTVDPEPFLINLKNLKNL